MASNLGVLPRRNNLEGIDSCRISPFLLNPYYQSLLIPKRKFLLALFAEGDVFSSLNSLIVKHGMGAFGIFNFSFQYSQRRELSL